VGEQSSFIGGDFLKTFMALQDIRAALRARLPADECLLEHTSVVEG